MASKLNLQQADKKIHVRTRNFVINGIFFINCSVNFSGQVLTDSLRTQERGVEKVRPQLSELSLAIESAVFHIYQNTADPMVWLNSENCGRIFNSNTAEGDFFLSK